MQVRFTLESHSVEGCFVGCISSTNVAYRSNIVIISEDVWSVEWFWLMCDWTCCILFSGLLLVNTWCCWRTSCGTRRLSKQTFSYKSMAWITSLRLGEWTFRWVEHGLWPYGGSQGHVDFFVCCLWGEVLVWFNIWKTKNTNIMSVVFELVFFWIRVSSCHPRVINPNWQAFVFKDSTAITGVIVEWCRLDVSSMDFGWSKDHAWLWHADHDDCSNKWPNSISAMTCVSGNALVVNGDRTRLD